MVTEQEYFNQYVKESDVHTDSIKFKKKLSSKQWMVLWQDCQLISEEKTAIGFWFKIKAVFKYGVTDWGIYNLSSNVLSCEAGGVVCGNCRY